MSLKTLPFPIHRPGIDVLMILEVFHEDGKNVCGIYKVRGTMDLKPKAFIRAVEAEMPIIEGMARDAGCEEMRVCGRQWSMLKNCGYEPFPALENGLRKAL